MWDALLPLLSRNLLFPLKNRKMVQKAWQEELHRWVATQLSKKHPNREHLVVLVNIQSQQCSSLSQAFLSLQELTQMSSPLHVVAKYCVTSILHVDYIRYSTMPISRPRNMENWKCFRIQEHPSYGQKRTIHKNLDPSPTTLW